MTLTALPKAENKLDEVQDFIEYVRGQNPEANIFVKSKAADKEKFFNIGFVPVSEGSATLELPALTTRAVDTVSDFPTQGFAARGRKPKKSTDIPAAAPKAAVGSGLTEAKIKAAKGKALEQLGLDLNIPEFAMKSDPQKRTAIRKYLADSLIATEKTY